MWWDRYNTGLVGMTNGTFCESEKECMNKGERKLWNSAKRLDESRNACEGNSRLSYYRDYYGAISLVGEFFVVIRSKVKYIHPPSPQDLSPTPDPTFLTASSSINLPRLHPPQPEPLRLQRPLKPQLLWRPKRHIATLARNPGSAILRNHLQRPSRLHSLALLGPECFEERLRCIIERRHGGRSDVPFGCSSSFPRHGFGGFDDGVVFQEADFCSAAAGLAGVDEGEVNVRFLSVLLGAAVDCGAVLDAGEIEVYLGGEIFLIPCVLLSGYSEAWNCNVNAIRRT